MYDTRNSTATALFVTDRVRHGRRNGRIHTQRVSEINHRINKCELDQCWILIAFCFEILEQEEHIFCERMTCHHMERATIRSSTRDRNGLG